MSYSEFLRLSLCSSKEIVILSFRAFEVKYLQGPSLIA
jgi:hypothetical protein